MPGLNTLLERTVSNGGLTMSAVTMGWTNTTSFNPASHISAYKIESIKKEGLISQGCKRFAEGLWRAFRKMDNGDGKVSFMGFQFIFQHFKTEFADILKINSLKEAFQIFEGGVVSEDDQVLILQVIKERMQAVANALLQIQQYHRFKQLMQEVRELEASITEWQNSVRHQRHKLEQEKCRKFSQAKINKLTRKYQQEYQSFNKVRDRTLTQHKDEFKHELRELIRQHSASRSCKFKPKPSFVNIQYQERLVALDERVGEALELRRELKNMEKKEAERADNFSRHKFELKHKSLRDKHARMQRLFELRKGEEEAKIIIRMRQEYDLLAKRNKLSELELRKRQGLEESHFKKEGVYRPELKRKKELSKSRNEILSLMKVGSKNFKVQDPDEAPKGVGRDPKPRVIRFVEQLKRSKRIIDFRLSRVNQEDIPINRQVSQSESKVQSWLNLRNPPQERTKSLSLCQLYDDSLRLRTGCGQAASTGEDFKSQVKQLLVQ